VSEDILSRRPPPADARLTYGTGRYQFLDLRVPSPNKPTKQPARLAINIHGGFWRSKYDLGYGGHLCAALTASGFATANLEYRRVGNEGGAWPGTFEDIRAAYGFLKQRASQHNFNPAKVTVIGHSAGGQLALCLAAHEPSVAGVVSLAGVVNLQKAYELHLSNDAVVDFLGGKPDEVPDHYREADPMRLSISTCRQFLMHGLGDNIVPSSFSREYVAAKRQRPVKEDVSLVEIPHADHFDLVDPQATAWIEVLKAVLQIAT
jgi:acetyl esterase/lipase